MPIPLPDPDGLSPPARAVVESVRALSAGSSRIKTERVLAEAARREPAVPRPDLFAVLLRLVRPWVCRYPLIRTHGNFGSIDGDAASPPRFTELSLPEGRVRTLPVLLCNGAWAHSGTWEPLPEEEDGHLGRRERPIGGELLSFSPPHNLGEVAAALGLLLDHPRATLDDVLRVLPGPDFPTGGILANPEVLREMYSRGEAELRVRGRVRAEATAAVIWELPYETTKTALVERLADAVKEGRLSDVRDVRDCSDNHSIRVEVEPAPGKDPAWILYQLQREALLESRVRVKMVLLRDGRAWTAGLMELLSLTLDLLPGDPRKTLAGWARQRDSRRTTLAD